MKKAIWICVLCLIVCAFVSCRRKEKEPMDNKKQTIQEFVDDDNSSVEENKDKNDSEDIQLPVNDLSDEDNGQQKSDTDNVNDNETSDEISNEEKEQDQDQEQDQKQEQEQEQEQEQGKEGDSSNPPSDEEESNRNPITLPPMKLN